KGVTFKGSWDGYIGFIESTDGPVLKKDMAKIVECLLLQVAKETIVSRAEIGILEVFPRSGSGARKARSG
ncbi:MAG: hypothetical protein EBZ78_08860, partial [Verrucomicrobia bacterium]|nr:hypothetical protein [Verrucomicrobiota bacterium]